MWILVESFIWFYRGILFLFFCSILSCRMSYAFFLSFMCKNISDAFLLMFLFVSFVSQSFFLGDFPRLFSRHLRSTPSSFHYNWKRSSLNIIVFASISELAFIKSSWDRMRARMGSSFELKTLQINRLSLQFFFNFRIVSHPTHCIILISSFCCVLERISRRLTFFYHVARRSNIFFNSSYLFLSSSIVQFMSII